MMMPPSRPVKVRWVLIWLLYPLAYLAYSLIRGAQVGGYPYPFFDPRLPGGDGRVAGICLAIAAAEALFAFFLVWVGNLRRLQASRHSPGVPFV